MPNWTDQIITELEQKQPTILVRFKIPALREHFVSVKSIYNQTINLKKKHSILKGQRRSSTKSCKPTSSKLPEELYVHDFTNHLGLISNENL